MTGTKPPMQWGATNFRTNTRLTELKIVARNGTAGLHLEPLYYNPDDRHGGAFNKSARHTNGPMENGGLLLKGNLGLTPPRTCRGVPISLTGTTEVWVYPC